jgi:hypothetical protein
MTLQPLLCTTTLATAPMSMNIRTNLTSLGTHTNRGNLSFHSAYTQLSKFLFFFVIKYLWAGSLEHEHTRQHGNVEGMGVPGWQIIIHGRTHAVTNFLYCVFERVEETCNLVFLLMVLQAYEKRRGGRQLGGWFT